METNIQEVMLRGKRVKLRPWENSDLNKLYEWRNDLSTLHLWSVKRHTVSYDEFVAEMNADFATDRHIQLMIERVVDNSVIGTIYSYGAQFVDGYCFITTYVEPVETGAGFGAEAVALMLAYLFSYFGFHKIYADAYDYNEVSNQCLSNAGFVEEGRFREHRYFASKRYDLVRYAIYSSQLPRIQQFIARLTRHRK